MERATQIDRMLLWFIQQLPEHNLSEWHFKFQPHEQPLDDEGHAAEDGRIGARHGVGHLRGYGRCERCGQRFDIPHAGNFLLHDEAEDARLGAEFPTLTRTGKVDTAKAWVQREAERTGKCWGDVPLPKPSGADIFRATFDEDRSSSGE